MGKVAVVSYPCCTEAIDEMAENVKPNDNAIILVPSGQDNHTIQVFTRRNMPLQVWNGDYDHLHHGYNLLKISNGNLIQSVDCIMKKVAERYGQNAIGVQLYALGGVHSSLPIGRTGLECILNKGGQILIEKHKMRISKPYYGQDYREHTHSRPYLFWKLAQLLQ